MHLYQTGCHIKKTIPPLSIRAEYFFDIVSEEMYNEQIVKVFVFG